MDDSDPTFGKLILTKKRSIALLLGSLGLLPTGLFLTFSPLADQEARTYVGPGLAAAGVACAIVGYIRRRHVFRLYERGIVDGPLRLPFSDIVELTAVLATISGDGVSGTNYDFKIVAETSEGRVTSRFSSGNLGHDMSRADQIIIPISSAIEKKWQAALDRGEGVCWGKHGELRSMQFDGGPPMKISDINHFKAEQSVLTIRTTAGHKATIRSTEPNFFPGYAMVQRMLIARKEAEDQAKRN